MDVGNIILLSIAALILIAVWFVVIKSGNQFRDKSKDVKNGMDEGQVMEIMEEDPISIEQLKNGSYGWIYEKREYRGWGMMVLKIEIVFTSEGLVSSVNRSKTYEKTKS